MRSTKRVLTADERISEVLFGLIMVITFTGSLSIGQAGRDDVRAMLIGALGCNLAWGIIDAVMYLMACMAEKGREARALASVHGADGEGEADAMLRSVLPDAVSAAMTDAEVRQLCERLKRSGAGSTTKGLDRDDWVGAVGVFSLVFLATLPVAIPFMLMPNVAPAMRASNAIAVGMLCVLGYAFGRCAGRNPWVCAVLMVFLGAGLAGVSMYFGG